MEISKRLLAQEDDSEEEGLETRLREKEFDGSASWFDRKRANSHSCKQTKNPKKKKKKEIRKDRLKLKKKM